MFYRSKKIISLVLVLAAVIGCMSGVFATSIPQYSVTFVTNDGGYVARLADYYQPGTLVAIRAVPYDGFIFYAWESNDVVLESYDTEMTRFVMPAKDIVIGVHFAKKQAQENQTISVSYNTFGGTELQETFINVGECVPKPATNPEKQGYVFEGWYSDAICTLPFNFEAQVYNAVILYAKWSPVIEESATAVFSDVSESAWYYEYVTSLAKKNYISGMGNSKFAPEANISRAQFATILANISGEAFTDPSNPFDDVSESAWYAKAVAWAYSKGIVNGKDAKTFAPNDNISRQDMAVMIMRYVTNVKKAALPEKNTGASFADDSQISSYANQAVYTMQKAGIIGGKPGNVFDPKANATRAEASKMIFVLLESIDAK